MVDSTIVLNGQAIAYTIYSIVIILLILYFGIMITREGKAGVLKTSLFTTLVVFLTVLGVSLHLITNQTIPWVSMDLNRSEITPDKVVEISVMNHEFQLPEEKITINLQDKVLFDVVSKDLTYGFGIFRQDNSMVCQMQVVPGHRNDLLWKFEKTGIYTIRSTEYSGPKGHQMIVKDVIEVVE
ncbi:MAG: cytochrome C oxidase subunit II [Bacteroidota bacterium]